MTKEDLKKIIDDMDYVYDDNVKKFQEYIKNPNIGEINKEIESRIFDNFQEQSRHEIEFLEDIYNNDEKFKKIPDDYVFDGDFTKLIEMIGGKDE